MGMRSARRWFAVPRAVKISMSFTKRELGRNLEQFPDRVDGAVHAVMEYQGQKAASHMKTNARWTDRTGNARNGLGYKVTWEPKVLHAIHLFHRVSYGIFLETRWAGRYAIILPTIQQFGPDTMRLLDKLFRRMGAGGGGMP